MFSDAKGLKPDAELGRPGSTQEVLGRLHARRCGESYGSGRRSAAAEVPERGLERPQLHREASTTAQHAAKAVAGSAQHFEGDAEGVVPGDHLRGDDGRGGR